MQGSLQIGRWVGTALRFSAVGLLAACTSSISDGNDPGAEPGGSASVGGNAGSVGTPASGSGNGAAPGAGTGAGSNGGNSNGAGQSSGASAGTGTGASAGVGAGPSAGNAAYLPARIRRLANAEYDASVHELLSTTLSPASGPDFPPDFRQNGFTLNEAQRVDSVIVQRLFDAADKLASEAQQNGTLKRLAPCANMGDAKSCARTFATTFGAKVYRRPLVDEEVAGLLALYDVGAEGATYEDGVAHMLRGLLQSAGFLYLTELGNGTPGRDGSIELTPHELAASLSYFLTSAPPDQQLLDKAVAGGLADAATRESEARRLLQTPLAQASTVRLVREWLGIDRIENSSKDSLVYPDFEPQKAKIVAESTDFVRAVTFQSTGKISELLGADWTVSSGPLALYKTAGTGPISNSSKITDRVGILNQAAFLAMYANAHESHPVLRGVAVGRRIACLSIPSPASLNIRVVPPAPDPTKSTRQRFEVHSTDRQCAGCHATIDPFGFSFEHFDGMGAYRAKEKTSQEELDVNSVVTVDTGLDFDGTYMDSNQLATALSQSEAVRTCFARYMFRAASATADTAAKPSEDAFVEAWRAIPAAAQGSIVETLLAYVKSPAFAVRRAQ